MFKSFMRHYSAERLERDTHSIIQADEIGRKPHHLQKIAELLDEYITVSNQETSIKDNSSLNTIQKKHHIAKTRPTGICGRFRAGENTQKFTQ